MNLTQATPTAPVRVPANHAVTKRLGNWTTARRFQVRAHRGHAVLDLRSPQIPAGDIEVEADLDHATLKLLVPDGANIDSDELRRVGRGRVKDWSGSGADGGRRIRLVGELRKAEVRVHRGGVAILSAVLSGRLREVRKAHREGRLEPA
jgi:hypothetical protein